MQRPFIKGGGLFTQYSTDTSSAFRLLKQQIANEQRPDRLRKLLVEVETLLDLIELQAARMGIPAAFN